MNHRWFTFAPLALAYSDGEPVEVHVLDAQAQRLHEPQARAVEQPGYERRWRRVHLLEEALDVAHREHFRHAAAPTGTLHVFEYAERTAEHMRVEEDERAG